MLADSRNYALPTGCNIKWISLFRNDGGAAALPLGSGASRGRGGLGFVVRPQHGGVRRVRNAVAKVAILRGHGQGGAELVEETDVTEKIRKYELTAL